MCFFIGYQIQSLLLCLKVAKHLKSQKPPFIQIFISQPWNMTLQLLNLFKMVSYFKDNNFYINILNNIRIIILWTALFIAHFMFSGKTLETLKDTIFSNGESLEDKSAVSYGYGFDLTGNLLWISYINIPIFIKQYIRLWLMMSCWVD